MLNANEIPDWDTSDCLERWWHEMAKLGVAFHPDDSPNSIIDTRDGKPCFTRDACSKLDGIISRMLDHYGDQTYDAGQRAIMRTLGWEESLDKNEWVKVG